MALRGYLTGEIVQDVTDGVISRREALRRLGLLGVSLAGASTLLAACGDDDAETGGAPATTTEGTPGESAAPPAGSGGEAELIRFQGPAGELQAAWEGAENPKGAVLVVHENRGITPHFYDVVARLAADGYSAICIDLLSRQGGTPSLGDEGAVQAALGEAETDDLMADLRAGIDELERRAPETSVGTVGFCFGGGMVWSLLDAGEMRLAAAAPFYGPAPEAADLSGTRAAVLAVYGELDDRVNATRDAATAALEAAGLTYEVKTYPGTDHAFFNDTGPRYNADAATRAYGDLLAWFEQHLA